MKTVTMANFRSHLANHLDEVTDSHEVVTITRNGTPAAVVLAADEWESIEETLFWFGPENASETLAAIEEADSGETIPAERVYAELAEKYGWPPRGVQS